MKIGIVGLGDIAQKAYLPVITQRDDLELVFCTRDPQTLAALAGKYRIAETCQDYRQLPAMKVDAVMIHAATHVHFEIASFFLEQGIPTFVDKPLCDNAAQVEQLYTLATRQQQPLYVGFNRRHIPLYNQYIPELAEQRLGALRSLRWEKHRCAHPGDVQTFIFDDFIHPLDSVNLNHQSDLRDVDVRVQTQGQQLARIDVSWESGSTLLCASMNRQFGTTSERVSACYDNHAFEFDSFVAGREWKSSEERHLKVKDWTPMLATKGFSAMINDWVACVNTGTVASEVVERNIATHRLADAIYEQVIGQLA